MNEKKNYKDNLIVKMTFDFALEVIEFAELLQSKRKFVIADQLLRSACSIGASVREAQNAESKADFVHKIKIAAKEAEESEYWLMLCEFAQSYPNPGKLTSDITGIIRVLGKILATSKSTNKRIGS